MPVKDYRMKVEREIWETGDLKTYHVRVKCDTCGKAELRWSTFYRLSADEILQHATEIGWKDGRCVRCQKTKREGLSEEGK